MKGASVINWKRRVGQVVRRLSPRQARAIIDSVNVRSAGLAGTTIDLPEIKALTGGFNSQSINYYVMRKLAVRAGICKRI
jgi:hypothetical protein